MSRASLIAWSLLAGSVFAAATSINSILNAGNDGLVSYRGADNNIIHAIFVNSEDRWDLARFLAPALRDVSPYTVVHAPTTVIFR